ncbi:MAG: CHASE3 domain-containing protein [Chitinophagaceae bacterium]|nr:CHASE3 domain-containing protein [Chitinophagaceae bacterium]
MKKLINKLRIDSRVRFGYGAAFILLTVSYLITLYANRQLVTQARLVDRSNKMIYHIEEMLSLTKDGENAVHRYLIAKDQKVLAPFIASRRSVDSIYKLLLKETKDNELQKNRLDTLVGYINSRYSTMQHLTKQLPAAGFRLTDTLNFTTSGTSLETAKTRSLALRMQAHEENLLRARSEELAERFVSLNAIVIASLIVAFLLFTLGFLTYLRENKARRLADKKVDEYQTQLKQQIEQLAGANKELIQVRSIEKFAATGRIARTIAHEVRNPLTNINLAIEQIKSDVKGEESLDILFDMVTRNSNRINQLITDLLNSTKFAELDYVKTETGAILDGALDLAEDRLSLHHIKVEKCYGSSCFIAADVDKMKIAFLNIIVNAVEAMEPEKGILKLSVTEKNDKCVIRISDNGSGMDSEALSRLFEPYFTSKMKGNGLGLTNSQNIILNHKGSILVESETGLGTTFIITLDVVR